MVLSALARNNQLLATGDNTTVVNKENNLVKTYVSVRAAARDIGISHVTVLKYINTNKRLKGIYLITRRTK
jgi:molybdenum-dependent DNA-binding transcriptional regulator ModE